MRVGRYEGAIELLIAVGFIVTADAKLQLSFGGPNTTILFSCLHNLIDFVDTLDDERCKVFDIHSTVSIFLQVESVFRIFAKKITEDIGGTEPTLNRNSIVYLVAKRVRRVVNQHSSFQVSPEHLQIFEVVAIHAEASISVEPVADKLLFA